MQTHPDIISLMTALRQQACCETVASFAIPEMIQENSTFQAKALRQES